jgi:hypothetical protein
MLPQTTKKRTSTGNLSCLAPFIDQNEKGGEIDSQYFYTPEQRNLF